MASKHKDIAPIRVQSRTKLTLKGSNYEYLCAFGVAPYEAVKYELRNAGYRGMLAFPALARGFIGKLKANASKNLFAVANGNDC